MRLTLVCSVVLLVGCEVEPPLDCRGVFQCAAQCPSSTTTECEDACVTRATDPALSQVTALVDCNSANGCTPDTSCLETKCGAQISACTGTTGAGGGTISGCPIPTGAGTTHNQFVTANATWSAVDNPHIVTAGITVAEGSTLTLEPCTEVRMKGGVGFTVRGSVMAQGTALKPIRIVADDASKPWSYLQLLNGSANLKYVTLENGGYNQDPNGLAVLEARGEAFAPRQEVLKVDHVTIKGSQQYGVSLRDGATFTPDSTALTISGATLGPIRTLPHLAGNIPAGVYTGNTIDEIVVAGGQIVTQDTTFHDRGVPYRVGDASSGADLRVGSGQDNATQSTLTLAPGVTVRMPVAGRIMMSTSRSTSTGQDTTTGVLVAQGTAAKPITFTSAAATRAAGDWVGLYFVGPHPSNRLDFVKVEYAGGASQANSAQCEPTSTTGGFSMADDAAILLFGRPSSASITNTTITASAGYGISRAWYGEPLDFLASNTFSQIATCHQGYPRAANGACPASVPCVK